MKRKYIDKLNIKFTETPQGYCSESKDKRKKEWKKERKKNGFDERELWDLNYTMNLFLYERLCYFKKHAPIDMEKHIMSYTNTSLKDCINKMIEGLKLSLTHDSFYVFSKDEQKLIDDIYIIYNDCKDYLWW